MDCEKKIKQLEENIEKIVEILEAHDRIIRSILNGIEEQRKILENYLREIEKDNKVEYIG